MRKPIVALVALTMATSAVANGYYFAPDVSGLETPVDLSVPGNWHKHGKGGDAQTDLEFLTSQSDRSYLYGLENRITLPENTILTAWELKFGLGNGDSENIVFDLPSSSGLKISGFFSSTFRDVTAYPDARTDIRWESGSFEVTGSSFINVANAGSLVFTGANTSLKNVKMNQPKSGTRYAIENGASWTGGSLVTDQTEDSFGNEFGASGSTLTDVSFKLSKLSHDNCWSFTNHVVFAGTTSFSVDGVRNKLVFGETGYQFAANALALYGEECAFEFGPGSEIASANGYAFIGGTDNRFVFAGPSTSWSGSGCILRMNGSGGTVAVSNGVTFAAKGIEIGNGASNCTFEAVGKDTSVTLNGDWFKIGIGGNGTGERVLLADGATMTVPHIMYGNGGVCSGSRFEIRDGASVSSASGLQLNCMTGGGNALVVDNGSLTLAKEFKSQSGGGYAAGPDSLTIGGTNGTVSLLRISADERLDFIMSIPKEGRAPGSAALAFTCNDPAYTAFYGLNLCRLNLDIDEKWARKGGDVHADLVSIPKATRDAATQLQTLANTVPADSLGKCTLSVVETETHQVLRLTAGPRRGLAILIR